MFKLEVVNFAKEKENCEAARKFNIGETSVREWRKEEAVIKCLHQKKRAVRYRRCSWPELEKHLSSGFFPRDRKEVKCQQPAFC
jgi:hypothetical protein